MLLVFAVFAAAPLIFFYIWKIESPKEVKRTPSMAQESNSSAPVADVPAHYETAEGLSVLGSSLAPEQFEGTTRAGYQAAKEIPQTLAQLPCYCHCDQGMGHKSLYSCFKDRHAANCDICVNEALEALRLEREGKMTPVQIRQRIISEYAE